MNWNWSILFSIELAIDSFLFIFNTKQNKTLLLWNENKSEIKEEVKLICSRPGTAIQNRKSKISMLIAGNCPSKQKKPELICSWPGTSVPKTQTLAKSLRFLFFFFERQFPAMNILILLFLFWMAVTGHEHTSFTFPVFNGREHNNFTFSVLNSSSRPWTN